MKKFIIYFDLFRTVVIKADSIEEAKKQFKLISTSDIVTIEEV